MPMEQDELDELEKLLKKARQKELPFGLCMGKQPENTVMILHMKKPPEVLMRQAKKAGETNKTTFGQCNVNGKVVSLTCEGDILPGMARNMKRFLLKNDIKMKVEILDPAGNLLESDGDEDEGEDQAPAATGEDENPAAEQWNKVHAALDPLVKRFAESGNEKGPVVRQVWDGAVNAANGGDFKSAMTAAGKVRPLVAAESGDGTQAAPDAQTDQPASAAPQPQDTDDPNAKKWQAESGPLQQLYMKAMENNPENRTKLDAAFGMAVEKADLGDYAAALTIAGRLRPALEAAAAAKGASTEIPKDVVAFQKSRILWSDTRSKMRSEMAKLEKAIVEVCKADEDLQPVVAEVKSLSARLEVFDDKLEDVLDEITNTPEGDQRTKLKGDAQTAIQAYQSALQDPFFKDVDNDNGFASVSIAATATKSLASIAKVLSAA